MNKTELEKAIEHGDSVWAVCNSPYKLVMEENLTKEYSVEPYYLEEQKWALWFENNYICDIDRVYKTKAEAEHYLYHANVRRTETLPFLTWEEFKEKKEISFKDYQDYNVYLYFTNNNKNISLFCINPEHKNLYFDATEENFYKAYDECVKLFKEQL